MTASNVFALAQDPVKLQLRLTADGSGNPATVEGSIDLPGLKPGASYCFYLPYNDSDYGQDWIFNRRFDISPQKLSNVTFRGGSTAVFSGKTPLPNDTLLKIRARSDHIALQFSSNVPRLPETDSSEWFFDGFYPQLLSHCPGEDEDETTVPIETENNFLVHIDPFPNWSVIAPGTVVSTDTYSLAGKSFVFSANKMLHVRTMLAEDVAVEMHYKSDSFLDVYPTIAYALLQMRNWVGPLPYKRLVVLESSDLQRSDIPGLIVFNSPKQSLFRVLESQWLNWRHWIAAQLVVGQWFGALISTDSKDDLWLLTGTGDFLAERIVSETGVRTNFFNSYENSLSYFKFTYLQMQELSAALLRRYSPRATLAETTLTSIPFEEQHPLAFIRHAFAMRQIYFEVGAVPFLKFLKAFVAKYKFRSISPKEFADFLKSSTTPLPQQRKAEFWKAVTRWWVTDGWPEYAVESFAKQKAGEGNWIGEVTIRKASDILSPSVAIEVKDCEGVTHPSRVFASQFVDDMAVVSLAFAYEPMQVVIDPNHEVFDSDRFNNSNKAPGFRFFPGSASTLEDSNYTLFWLPYPFRRPGEGTSVGIMAALFRYLQSSLYIRVEEELATKHMGGMLRYEKAMPSLALKSQLFASQTYEGFRLAEAAIDRSPLFSLPTKISAGLRLRHRETVGVTGTAHQTAAEVLDVDIPLVRGLHLGLSGENENAPKLPSSSFSYTRRKFIANLQVSPGAGLDFFARGFSGRLISEDEVPDLALFGPEDLVEARLRIDISGLDRVNTIQTLTNDLSFPFIVPFPGDSLILSRHIKGRLFYDFGYSQDSELFYRDGGVGAYIPFGGDLAGVGSFALTRFSILAVLYSQVGDDTSKKPRILFDLAGEL